MLKNCVYLALAVALCSLAWASYCAAELLQSAEHALTIIPWEIQAARAEILVRTNAQLDKLNKQLADTRAMLDSRAGQALQIVDSRSQEAAVTLAGFRSDVKPVLENAASLVRDGQDSLDDLYPDIRAAVESATVASTSVAQSAQDVSVLTGEFRRALPVTLAGVNRIVANSDKTTAASARVLTNLDLSTRPLPKWMRWTFGISGQIAPTAAGALGAAAAVGAFR